MSFDAGEIIATLRLNRDPFDRTLDEAVEKARTFDEQPIEPDVRLNTDEFDVQSAELETEKELLSTPIDIPVRLQADRAAAEAAVGEIAGVAQQAQRDSPFGALIASMLGTGISQDELLGGLRNMGLGVREARQAIGSYFDALARDQVPERATLANRMVASIMPTSEQMADALENGLYSLMTGERSPVGAYEGAYSIPSGERSIFQRFAQIARDGFEEQLQLNGPGLARDLFGSQAQLGPGERIIDTTAEDALGSIFGTSEPSIFGSNKTGGGSIGGLAGLRRALAASGATAEEIAGFLGESGLGGGTWREFLRARRFAADPLNALAGLGGDVADLPGLASHLLDSGLGVDEIQNLLTGAGVTAGDATAALNDVLGGVGGSEGPGGIFRSLSGKVGNSLGSLIARLPGGADSGPMGALFNILSTVNRDPNAATSFLGGGSGPSGFLDNLFAGASGEASPFSPLVSVLPIVLPLVSALGAAALTGFAGALAGSTIGIAGGAIGLGLGAFGAYDVYKAYAAQTSVNTAEKAYKTQIANAKAQYEHALATGVNPKVAYENYRRNLALSAKHLQGAKDAANAITSKLPSGTRKAAAEVRSAIDTIRSNPGIKQLEGAAIPGIGELAQGLAKSLPAFLPFFKAAAKGTDAFFDSFVRGIDSKGFKSFMGQMAKDLPPIMKDFATFVKNMGGAWAKFLEIFAGKDADDIGKWFDNISKGFEDWFTHMKPADVKEMTGVFGDFGDIIKLLWGGISKLFDVLVPVGVELFKLLDPTVKLATQIIKLIPPSLLRDLALVAIAIAAVATPVGGVIAGIALLSGAIIYLEDHWATIWNGIKTIAFYVWGAIDTLVVQPIEHFFKVDLYNWGLDALGIWSKAWNALKAPALAFWHWIDSTIIHPLMRAWDDISKLFGGDGSPGHEAKPGPSHGGHGQPGYPGAGPSTYTGSTTSYILPNATRYVRNAGTNNVTVNMAIDARSSTDPTATRAQVSQAINAAIPGLTRAIRQANALTGTAY